MKISCPVCSKLIPPSGMNLETDVALCTGCHEAFAISTLIAAGQDSQDFDLSNMPRGTWFSETFDGWTIGASTRSAAAFFIVPFMCVWSGFSLGGIYGTQIAKGEFVLLASLFGIPFLLGTLLFGSIAVMTVCGKVTVTVDGNRGCVFVGAGPMGWTGRFDWGEIKRIDQDLSSVQHAGNHGAVIVLVGKTKLKFGSMLTEPRREFVLQALRRLLTVRSK